MRKEEGVGRREEVLRNGGRMTGTGGKLVRQKLRKLSERKEVRDERGREEKNVG